MSLSLTVHGAAEDLQPHTQRAVPALRNDSDVPGQYGLCQLVHHWNVLITVSKEQLGHRDWGKNESKKEGGTGCKINFLLSASSKWIPTVFWVFLLRGEANLPATSMFYQHLMWRMRKWHHFRWTHPVSVSIVDGGPFSAVIAESQEVGHHKVIPVTKWWEGLKWYCDILGEIMIHYIYFDILKSQTILEATKFNWYCTLHIITSGLDLQWLIISNVNIMTEVCEGRY